MANFLRKYLSTCNKSQVDWLKSIEHINDPIISVQHPDWKGIRSSSEQLFQHHYYITDNLSENEIRQHANVLIESKTKCIILNGFPNSFAYLIKYLKTNKPEIKILLIYHGNFMHNAEDYSWWALKNILSLIKENKIDRIGFVKRGMNEVFLKQNIKAYFIKNHHNFIPTELSNTTVNKEINVGIWTNGYSWQKAPWSMISSLALLDNIKLFGSGFTNRVIEFCDLLKINHNVTNKSLNKDELFELLKQMHVNLYITMSECAPMFPLESFSLGVPCLIGPNTHYFENNDYLKSRLIVSYPDDPSIIAKMLKIVLAERTEIMKEYIKFTLEYNTEARESVKTFLNF